MINNIIDFYKEPPIKEEIQDKTKIKKDYFKYRWQIFTSCFLGYVVFYLCKKNIAVALPQMGADLGYSNVQLGMLGSSLYFTYAIGRFINGIVADRADVRKFFPTALILVAIANFLFAISFFIVTPGKFSFFGLHPSSVLLWVMVLFWGANGWFQSMGFPSVAKSLSYWFSNSERGTKWALWSTSHQIGTALSVALSGFIIAKLGWQAAFYIPAVIAVVMAIFLFITLRDKPQSLGLPEIETYNNEEDTSIVSSEDDGLTYWEIFKKYILSNKTLWILAFAYIFVYIVRFGTEDWIIKYLVEFKGDTLAVATSKMFCKPFFGIAGAIAAGFISDKYFKGKRAPVNIIFLAGIIVSLALLFCHTQSSKLDFLLIGMVGFFTYGPHMLIGGLCAVESSSKKVASAATGFTGTFGYIGAIFSGFGTGYVIDHFGWNAALIFWALAALSCLIVCLPTLKGKR